MASSAAADPWSVSGSDPWHPAVGSEGVTADAVVNEPNGEANVQTQHGDGDPQWGNLESRESASAPMMNSWDGEWGQRRGDNSSDGSSGDAATTAGRRASDGSWGSWSSWNTWHPEWHGGWWNRWGDFRSDWRRHHWDGGDSMRHSANPDVIPMNEADESSTTRTNLAEAPMWNPATTPPRTTTSAPTARPWTTSTRPDKEMEQHSYGNGKGPSEKLLIPTFSGDAENGSELGTSARSYLRQVAAWEKMTKLSLGQRALVLYQNLQSSAWVNAESLDVNALAQNDGVEYLKDWIRQHYLDVEVTQVGRSLSDLFRKLRRRPTQTFRDYTAEFNRLLARVTECGCKLPDVANAWLFVDRANLDETTEVSLLASVGNKYALKELQQAAIVLDRSIRKPWEKSSRGEAAGGRRYNTVHHAADGAYDEDADTDEEAMLEDRIDQDTGELYISYMTAKARYRDAAKSRGTVEAGNKGGGKGFDPTAVKKAAEGKILLAKAKSHCAACGQRGHWHRDPECPKRQGGEKTQTVHVTNEIYELSTYGNPEALYAILDSACSKTVVGTAWLERYLASIRGKGYDTDFVYEKECFKFGAANKIYESTYAAIVMMNCLGKWVAVKAAVVHGDLPLLLSRPALGCLGLVLDLGGNCASFRKLGEGELTLLETAGGHPAILIDQGLNTRPDVSLLPKKWEAHGIEVLCPRVVYMTRSGDDGLDSIPGSTSSHINPKIFYDKKIDPAVRDMLVADVLNETVFLAWWSKTQLHDFWIETPEKLVRVHTTPRKYFFDPRSWNTPHALQREQLMMQLGSVRETCGIGCMSQRLLSNVAEVWIDKSVHATDGYPVLWVGRSVFNRQAIASSCSLPRHEPGCFACAGMEDDKDPVVGRGDLSRAGCEPQVDVPGAADGPHGGHRVPQGAQAGSERPVVHDPRGAAQRGGEAEDSPGGEGDARKCDVESEGRGDPRLDRDGHRAIPRDQLHRHPGELRAVGLGRGEGERGQHVPGPEAVCALAATSADFRGGEATCEAWLPGPREGSESAPAADERDRLLSMGTDRGPGGCEQRLEADHPLGEFGKWSASQLDAATHNVTLGSEGQGDTTTKDARDEGTNGAGRRPGHPHGDPGARGATGRSERQVRDSWQQVSGGDLGGAEGACDATSFRSCSSGSEDGAEEVFVSQKVLAKLGEDHVGARHHAEHPGEVAARRALTERDFSYERIFEILNLYDFTACTSKRTAVHLQDGGDRVALGYYAYGNFKGICKNSIRWGNLVRYVNAFLVEHSGGGSEQGRPTYWGAVTLLRNCPASVHTDKNNLKGSPNFVVSFGDGPGGGLWVEFPGGGTWRRDQGGQEVEGIVIDTNRQVWEFDPRARHASEAGDGGRWTIVAYTPRTFPDGNKTEKKILRDLGFPLPTAGLIRQARSEHATRDPDLYKQKTTQVTNHAYKPRRSQRKALWKTAAFLNVLFTTVLSTMGQAVGESVPVGHLPCVGLLEVGGFTATCRVGEYCGDFVKVLEPILSEDILNDDHPAEFPFGKVETAVIRHQPGQLWIHVRPEWEEPQDPQRHRRGCWTSTQ